MSSPGHNVIIGSSVHQLIGQVIREVITCHQVISGHQKVIMGWGHPRESRVDPLLEFARGSLLFPIFDRLPYTPRPRALFIPSLIISSDEKRLLLCRRCCKLKCLTPRHSASAASDNRPHAAFVRRRAATGHREGAADHSRRCGALARRAAAWLLAGQPPGRAAGILSSARPVMPTPMVAADLVGLEASLDASAARGSGVRPAVHGPALGRTAGCVVRQTPRRHDRVHACWCRPCGRVVRTFVACTA